MGPLSLAGVLMSHPGGKNGLPVELLDLDSDPRTGGTSWALSPVLPHSSFLNLKEASLFHTAGPPPLHWGHWGQVSLCRGPSWASWGAEQHLWPHPLYTSTPSLTTTDVPRHGLVYLGVGVGVGGGRAGLLVFESPCPMATQCKMRVAELVCYQCVDYFVRCFVSA